MNLDPPKTSYSVIIDNIESFSNYRTVGDDFVIMTSVLSKNNNLIPINNSKSNNLTYNLISFNKKLFSIYL